MFIYYLLIKEVLQGKSYSTIGGDGRGWWTLVVAREGDRVSNLGLRLWGSDFQRKSVGEAMLGITLIPVR